jgi:prepilin-type N-terminal cleavage/methylation domain-containing protein
MRTALPISGAVLPPLKRERGSPFGFTLIEMIIAVFIALIIFMVGFSSISTTMAVRKDSEARIGATEDSRMFFQLLERDLAGAYPMSFLNLNNPAGGPPQDSLTQKINGKTVAISPSFRLEFYTRVDHRGVADQLVFVRYYVNNNAHLCREVVDSIDPASIGSADTRHHYPLLTTQIPPFTPATDLKDDTDAVFDQTNSLIINPLQWNADQKVYTACAWGQATHFQVELMMYDLKGFPPKRSFIRTIELPMSMTNY